MSVASARPLMTTEELLALPEDTVERWPILGQLREKPITRRNRWHGRALIRIGYLLEACLETQPEPRGEIFGGEAGCRLSREPDSTVGLDVACFSADVINRHPKDTRLIDGGPVLAVEILSPSDKMEEINEKIDVYLQAGVPLAWVIDPHFQTVDVYCPDRPPERFNINKELTGEPHLPGFRTPVARIFHISQVNAT